MGEGAWSPSRRLAWPPCGLPTLHRVPQRLASTHQAAALRASCGAAAVSPKVRALLEAVGLREGTSPACNLSLGPCLPSHAEPRPACGLALYFDARGSQRWVESRQALALSSRSRAWTP